MDHTLRLIGQLHVTYIGVAEQMYGLIGVPCHLLEHIYDLLEISDRVKFNIALPKPEHLQCLMQRACLYNGSAFMDGLPISREFAAHMVVVVVSLITFGTLIFCVHMINLPKFLVAAGPGITSSTLVGCICRKQSKCQTGRQVKPKLVGKQVSTHFTDASKSQMPPNHKTSSERPASWACILGLRRLCCCE